MSLNKQDYFIEAMLLAAGASTRFKQVKQLASVGGSPMVVHSVCTLADAEFDSVTVVLGANSVTIKQVLEKSLHLTTNSHRLEHDKSVNIVVAENWQFGMGASIAEGMANIHPNASHVLIGLADQVEICATQYTHMVACSVKSPHNIVAALYNGKLGAPAIFPKVFFGDLAKLQDDKGARDILRENANRVISIEMPEAAKDIDTQKDLASYEKG